MSRRALRIDWNSIHQELRARDNHFVSGLHSVEYDVIVVDHLANLQRFLARDVRSVFAWLRDECKVLSSDAGNREDRHNRTLLCAPDHARTDELRLPKLVLAIGDAGLNQDCLC